MLEGQKVSLQEDWQDSVQQHFGELSSNIGSIEYSNDM